MDGSSDNYNLDVTQQSELIRSTFRELYRKCVRTNALSKGEVELRTCIEKSVRTTFSLEAAKVDDFKHIAGYRLVIDGHAAFFPATTSVADDGNDGLSWLRETFLSVDLVMPPFWTMQTLHSIANEIHRDSNHDRREKLTAFSLSHLYKPASLAALCCSQYSQRKAMAQHYAHILESVKAYFLGLYGAAITTLIPCLEAAMRGLGEQIEFPIAGRIDRQSFLRVLNKLQLYDIEKIVFNGYDWFPTELFNVSYFEKFNERIQMIGSIKYFIEHKMYKDTNEYDGSTGLNRHGIVHGLISGFDTPANYLRLITLLNSLCVACMIAGDVGSFFHPPETVESKKLARNFMKCKMSKRLIGS